MKLFCNIRYYLACFFILISIKGVTQNTINGVVLDQKTKEKLIGANIIIKESNTGTTTDLNGEFSITHNQIPFNIECSYIGYQTLIFEIKNNESKITIELLNDEMILSDINVVDNRLSEKLKQSPVTIEAMDVIAIKEAPSSSFYEGLGTLKGVDLTSASLGFKIINTRGFNSTSPVRSLQIIDGVDNQSPGLNFSLGNFLGTTELDTKGVEIIVGANSALYGPNAFNGVINMSTKDPFRFPGTSYQIKIGERGLIENCFRYAVVKKLDSSIYPWRKNIDFFKDIEVGFKINIQHMKANDWEADNMDVVYDTDLNINNLGGYDAVNKYGDEWFSGSETSFKNAPSMGTLRRTGYMESDLADYNTKNFKFNTALHFKKNNNELIYAFNFGNGTTIYQGDNRYSLKNIRFWQNKIEFKRNDNFFIRFYTTNEDAGDSYDIVATAQALSQKSSDNAEWVTNYKYYWNELITNLDGFVQNTDFVGNEYLTYYLSGGELTYPNWISSEYGVQASEAWESQMGSLLSQNPNLLAEYHTLAREYADNQIGGVGFPFLTPGTTEFDILFNEIISQPKYDPYGRELGGTKFYDKSSLYHLQAEKKIDTDYGSFIFGANARLYKPDSQGSIFNDGFDYVLGDSLDSNGNTVYGYQLGPGYINDNQEWTYDTLWAPLQVYVDTVKLKITNYEFGGYLGYDHKLFSETLLVNATARLDKNKNFNYLFSPAASLVYKPNERDIIRLSLSSAIRNPTLTDQYLNYDAGPATLLGNLDGFGFNENFVTVDAMLDCIAAETTTLGFPAAYFLTNGRLQVDPIKPEQVKTIETGFRTTLFNKVYIDASYYYSVYNNFIGYQLGATYKGASDLVENTLEAEQEDVNGGWADYEGQIIDNYKSIDASSVRFYRVAANAKEQVTTQGFSIGINYYMNAKTAVNGNYSWNKLINEDSKDPLIPAYNTPEHKFNIGISKKFSISNNRDNEYSISLNYKWIQGFLFEGSPQFTGPIESYGLLDGQINRVFNINNGELTAKIGVSNLLNNQVYQAYGGPRVGRLSYISFTFNY